jgi:hypothetical protein
VGHALSPYRYTHSLLANGDGGFVTQSPVPPQLVEVKVPAQPLTVPEKAGGVKLLVVVPEAQEKTGGASEKPVEEATLLKHVSGETDAVDTTVPPQFASECLITCMSWLQVALVGWPQLHAQAPVPPLMVPDSNPVVG